MDLEPEVASPNALPKEDFAELTPRKPLERWWSTEALLRSKTVEVLVPVLPSSMANRLETVSDVATAVLSQLVAVDLDKVSDLEMRSPRIFVGLTFIGFGSLFIVLLMLYLCTLHPELSPVEQIRQYWYQYVWFVSLGIAGMFMLGREAMRPAANNMVSVSKAKLNRGRAKL